MGKVEGSVVKNVLRMDTAVSRLESKAELSSVEEVCDSESSEQCLFGRINKTKSLKLHHL